MIYINNNSLYNLEGLIGLLKKFKLKVKINKQSLKDEVERLLDIDIRHKSEIYKTNINLVIDEIDSNIRFLDMIGNDTLEIKYVILNNNLDTSPIKIRDIKMFDIQATDFMNIDKFTVVDVDYTDLMTALSKSCMYEDLGLTLDDIEKAFGDNGFSKDIDSSLLSNLIDPDMDYRKLRGLKIDTCPYVNPNRKEIIDYYQEVLEYPDDDRYRTMLESSSNKTVRIILTEVLNNLIKYRDKLGIASISDTGYKVLIYNQDDNDLSDILNIIREPVSMKLLGRSFKCDPKINIIKGV